MKHDLALLAHEVEKKIKGYVKGKEKPSRETLDKLALFVGYQSWEDFHEALHGEDDGRLNYEVEDETIKGDSDIS